jgi:hypothetical protein
MNWLGLDFRIAKNGEIGSRLQFSSAKAPLSQFIEDLKLAFSNVVHSMVPGATCVVVQGDSRVQGVMHSGADIISSVGRAVGLNVLEIDSSFQFETSKQFNRSFAVKGKLEHVIVLTKPKGRSGSGRSKARNPDLL